MKLDFCPAPKPNGSGVLLTPGGGYGYVAYEKEGTKPSQWLNDRGFDAWILTYTTAEDKTPPLYPVPQDEALEAIRQIRSQNRVSKLGIWGWSAGGHLAAVTATTPEAGLDFAVLAYPVISMEPSVAHMGSREKLLGADPSEALVQSMTAQNRVSAATPPTFIFHTANDGSVPVQNSLLFASAMAENKRPFEIFVLPDGPHGVGMALDDPKHTWTAEVDRWMKDFVKES
jgi:acetyl esterase/lipase